MMRSWRTGASASGDRGGRIAIAAACLVAVLFVPRPAWSGDDTYNVPPGAPQTVTTPITDDTAPPPPTTVVKNGGGTLILDADNSYTGGTIINGGTLALGPGGSIASSSGVNLAASGATFDVSGSTGIATILGLSGVSGSTVNLGGFIGTGTPGFTETGVPVGPDGGDIGLGVNVAIAQSVLPAARMAGFLQYDAMLASHETASNVAAGLRVKW